MRRGARLSLIAVGVTAAVLGGWGGCGASHHDSQATLLSDGSDLDGSAGTAGRMDAKSVDAVTDGAADASDSSLPQLGPSPFAAPCRSNAECAPGLVCLLADSDAWLGGGPARGYCSLACSDDPSRCSKLDRYARCLTSPAMHDSYCFKSCVLGTTSGADKCDDRADVSCVLVDGLPACLPNCGGDVDCPTGRYCNHTHGVCVRGTASGDPVGAECDPASPNTCSAYCSSLGNGFGVCSGLCVLGAASACDVDPGETELRGLPLCMSFNPLDGPGDAGICVQRCRCNEDCGHPRAYCDFTRPEAVDGLGLCLFNFDAEAGRLGKACGAFDAAVPVRED